jgi:cytochrome bd-type quinol oxidase subunit 2
MDKENGNRDRVTKWIRWIARIWSVPILVYALLFIVGTAWNLATTGVADPHAVEDYPWTEVLPPIFLLLSILGLGIAWRWERLGGTIAVVCLLAVVILLFIQTPITRNLPHTAIPYLLSIIVGIPGILFLVCWRRSQ